MIELSVVRDLVAIFGVIAGLTYYVMVMRNAQRVQKLQLILNFQQNVLQQDFHRSNTDFLYHQSYADYDEWLEKYGPSTNSEAYSKMMTTWASLRYLGIILQESLVDPDIIWRSVPPSWIILAYERLEPLLSRWREAFNDPNIGVAEEHLYNLARKQFPDIRRASEIIEI